MFYRFTVSNLHLNGFPYCMFGLAQTFSPNILPYEQMFGHLATSANKECASEKKQPIRGGIFSCNR